MSNQTSSSKSFALASRFLHALRNLTKLLSNNIGQGMERLNVAQLRILQVVHDNPGIRADTVIGQLELEPDAAVDFMLAMEQSGLLSLDRSIPDVPPTLKLGSQGQRLAFQVQATQLVAIAELFSKLPEADQLTAVEVLEQVAAQRAE